MSLTSDIDLLRQVPFFAEFGEDQLRLVAFGAETRVYRAKQVIFRQGDLADSGFVITEGRVRMTISVDGVDQQSQTLDVGGLIGEMALYSSGQTGFGSTGAMTKPISIGYCQSSWSMDKSP